MPHLDRLEGTRSIYPLLSRVLRQVDLRKEHLVKDSKKARLAQPVERKALNLVVVGSSPTVGGGHSRLDGVWTLWIDANMWTLPTDANVCTWATVKRTEKSLQRQKAISRDVPAQKQNDTAAVDTMSP